LFLRIDATGDEELESRQRAYNSTRQRQVVSDPLIYGQSYRNIAKRVRVNEPLIADLGPSDARADAPHAF